MTRLYDATHGQVQEFLKRLAGAGLTQEDIVRLTNNPPLMQSWIESLGKETRITVNLDTPIEILFGKSKLASMLKRAGIKTVDHLIDWTEDELGDIRNCGDRSLAVIKATLAEHFLSLSTRNELEAPDNSRIYSRLDRTVVMRPWRRRDIGHLPLSWFVLLGGKKYAELPGQYVNDKIGDIASLSDDELRKHYGAICGQNLLVWLNKNYRQYLD